VKTSKTRCTVGKMTIPTYPSPAAEKLPMYCENRSHQRTTGRVYPCAIVKDVVRDHKIDQEYTSIILENDYIELIILPELGGRIFGARDKTNNYDFFYRQHVIKPALIGLLGSWISGGAEFNWPVHHRPSTFMPTDFHIEESDDGSVIVWLSEHEPLGRMKGMVGIKLCPDKAMFETIGKVYNRTELPQSFLWWENIAVPVNESYKIFFPHDVNHVHFHGKRSVIEFPLTRKGMFSGKEYADGVDLRWHRNTREATSYFAAASRYDFFGGFDHGLNAGVVHVANHHVSPGKKLFTWAYGQLAKSWENALTDSDGPYAELMASSYSDNQPDFTWLEAGETKQFSQFWYPIKDLGEPLNANTRVALTFSSDSGEIKIYAVENLKDVTVEIIQAGLCVHQEKVDLPIGLTTVIKAECLRNCKGQALRVRVVDSAGCDVISFSQADIKPADIPQPRLDDPSPYSMDNAEDLYLAGLHLMQYRDPLARPGVYWLRAIEINPLHYNSLIGLGLEALRSCRLGEANDYLQRAVEILTRYNPNPRDGEAYYLLGLAQRLLGKPDNAYDAFYKSTWNFHWRAPGYYELAVLDCARKDFQQARTHLRQALDACADYQHARNLLAVVERRLGGSPKELLAESLRRDPLDYFALNEAGEDFFPMMASDPSQTLLDIAFDYTRAGLLEEVVDLLERLLRHQKSVSPIVLYCQAWALENLGRKQEASAMYDKAKVACPDYCFPSRIEEMQILQHAVVTRQDSRAAYYLGNLLYSKDQHDAAIAQWEFAQRGGESYYVLYRNLAMGYNNDRRDAAAAVEAMRKALAANPGDPQLIYELNHLLNLVNAPIEDRLHLLEANQSVVRRRDDLQIEWVRAYNQAGNCAKALDLLREHTFTPCEGGEHNIAEQHIFAHLSLGRQALRAGDTNTALGYFQAGQVLPGNLGAGIWNAVMYVPCRHYEALCLKQLSRSQEALKIWQEIADTGIDTFAAATLPSLQYFRAMAMVQLARKDEAQSLLRTCIAQWQEGLNQKDHGYFAVIPFFHSFLTPPSKARKVHYSYLLGLAYKALGDEGKAREYFSTTLREDAGQLLSALELQEL
jgi:tetratricopeptide (TPR) repeat protein